MEDGVFIDKTHSGEVISCHTSLKCKDIAIYSLHRTEHIHVFLQIFLLTSERYHKRPYVYVITRCNESLTEYCRAGFSPGLL